MKLARRAAGASGESTTTSLSSVTSPASSLSSAIASTTSSTPFFSAPSSLTKPSTTEGHGTALTKSILEWVVLVIAIVFLTAFFVRRSFELRKRNQPISRFFTSTRPSQPSTSRPQNLPRTGLPSLGLRPLSSSLTPGMLYPTLDPLPSAHTRGRRTTAADTDRGGRRAGATGDDDAKDALPAYDGSGGPPMYMELEMMDNIRTRLHLNFAGVMGQDPGREETALTEEGYAMPEPWQAHHRRESSRSSQEPPAVLTTPPLAEPDPHIRHQDIEQ